MKIIRNGNLSKTQLRFALKKETTDIYIRKQINNEISFLYRARFFLPVIDCLLYGFICMKAEKNRIKLKQTNVMDNIYMTYETNKIKLN